MKLIVAIINNDDSAVVISELTQKGYSATKLSTSGGFLRAGNSTLLIGTEEENGRRYSDDKRILTQEDSDSPALTRVYDRGLHLKVGGSHRRRRHGVCARR